MFDVNCCQWTSSFTERKKKVEDFRGAVDCKVGENGSVYTVFLFLSFLTFHFQLLSTNVHVQTQT